VNAPPAFTAFASFAAPAGAVDIVNRIAEHGKSPDLVERVSGFVRQLAEAVRSVR